MCGEKCSITYSHNKTEGSPPRVRGKDAGAQGELQHPRITPACAGKRNFFASGLDFLGDHPRVCGEKDTDETDH